MKTITPAFNGFLKGLGVVLLMSALTYLADAANTAPLLGIGGAALLSGLASAIESHIRSHTGKGLFGATKVG